MGISNSCNLKYPSKCDFIHFVQRGCEYITASCQIWTSEEQHCLSAFFTNLNNSLTDTSNPELPWRQAGNNWPSDQTFTDYFIRARSAIAQSNSVPKIYALAGQPSVGPKGGVSNFNTDFAILTQVTQIQLAHFYAALAFLSLLYKNEKQPLTYFMESDILIYLSQISENSGVKIDTVSIECLLQVLSKIYFDRTHNLILPGSLLMAICPFTVCQGTLASLDSQKYFSDPSVCPPGVYLSCRHSNITVIKPCIDIPKVKHCKKKQSCKNKMFSP